MVTPDEALPAGANVRIPVVLSQFKGLIHPTVSVPQVRRLRRPQVGTETFYSTSSSRAGERKVGSWYQRDTTQR
jgi:hypothetical protein